MGVRSGVQRGTRTWERRAGESKDAGVAMTSGPAGDGARATGTQTTSTGRDVAASIRWATARPRTASPSWVGAPRPRRSPAPPWRRWPTRCRCRDRGRGRRRHDPRRLGPRGGVRRGGRPGRAPPAGPGRGAGWRGRRRRRNRRWRRWAARGRSGSGPHLLRSRGGEPGPSGRSPEGHRSRLPPAGRVHPTRTESETARATPATPTSAVEPPGVRRCPTRPGLPRRLPSRKSSSEVGAQSAAGSSAGSPGGSWAGSPSGASLAARSAGGDGRWCGTCIGGCGAPSCSGSTRAVTRAEGATPTSSCRTVL